MVVPGREILTIPDTPTTQGLSLWCFNSGARDFDHPRHSSHLLQRLSLYGLGLLWCFNIHVVGREILTIPDTSPTTQGLSLWSFNIVSCTIVRRGSARTARGSDAGRVPGRVGECRRPCR